MQEEKRQSARVPGRIAYLCALAVLAVLFTVAFPALNRPVATAPYGVPVAQATVTQTDSIDQFRTEREQVRDVEIRQLNALIADEGADEELRGAARRQLLSLTSFMEQEVTLEGVLRARGFTDALATVHAESVNVLVRADSLTRAQSATILELALRETGQQSGNIKIIPIAP